MDAPGKPPKVLMTQFIQSLGSFRRKPVELQIFLSFHSYVSQTARQAKSRSSIINLSNAHVLKPQENNWLSARSFYEYGRLKCWHFVEEGLIKEVLMSAMSGFWKEYLLKACYVHSTCFNSVSSWDRTIRPTAICTSGFNDPQWVHFSVTSHSQSVASSGKKGNTSMYVFIYESLRENKTLPYFLHACYQVASAYHKILLLGADVLYTFWLHHHMSCRYVLPHYWTDFTSC